MTVPLPYCCAQWHIPWSAALHYCRNATAVLLPHTLLYPETYYTDCSSSILLPQHYTAVLLPHLLLYSLTYHILAVCSSTP